MGGQLDGNFLLGSLPQVYFDCHIDYLLCGEYIFFSSLIANVGGVAQWENVGLWPANFPCPALDLQLMGDH